MKKNKYPSLNGIPAEFYQTFWDELNDFLLLVFKNVFEKGGLTNTQENFDYESLTQKGGYYIFKQL